MTKPIKFGILVAFLLLAASVVMWASYDPHAHSPTIETLLAFTIVAFLLEQSSTKLSAGGLGSTSFVIHIAAGLIFGAFWGAVVTGAATILFLVSLERAPLRVTFNACQRILSVSLGVHVYSSIGGATPPISLQETFFPFLLLSSTYFLINSVSVSAAISIGTDKPFREVWSLNSRGVIGFDLAASSIALLLAWIYKDWGLAGLFVAVLPTLVVRHVYVMYRDMQESSRELLKVMVKSIEARDPYTSGHSVRVRMLSRAIALELNLPMKQLEQVETAALLHDVGKIHEEFAPLLRKESRLTPEETALMQTHAEKSAELVGIVSKFQGFIHDSVRHHHERWDGQGYPDGVSGKQIPLGARIILIADTIDAMTTDRPYRKRLPLDVVIAELEKCKGGQFDPELIQVVVNSVAVRRLIGGDQQSVLESDAPRSRRVTWPTSGLWRRRA